MPYAGVAAARRGSWRGRISLRRELRWGKLETPYHEAFCRVAVLCSYRAYCGSKVTFERSHSGVRVVGSAEEHSRRMVVSDMELSPWIAMKALRFLICRKGHWRFDGYDCIYGSSPRSSTNSATYSVSLQRPLVGSSGLFLAISPQPWRPAT